MVMLLSFATGKACFIYSTAACAYTVTHFIYHLDNGHAWLAHMCVCVLCVHFLEGARENKYLH